MTLADMLHLTAYVFIIASVAQSTASLWLWENDHFRASRNLDGVFRGLHPMCFGVTTWLVVRAA